MGQEKVVFQMPVIPFNRPFIGGRELENLSRLLDDSELSSFGTFSQYALDFFRNRYGFEHAFLTKSCTAALEMTALLLQIQPGDEVILPSYNYVSAANAFALRGASLIFADSLPGDPNIDPGYLASLLTPKTKAIVVTHYGGYACDMDSIVKLARESGCVLIEDAAHCIHAFYQQRPLGSFGQYSTFSFHDTKNITCGEGGLLVVNHPEMLETAKMVLEKGTDRLAFQDGHVSEYTWQTLGSSFVLSELNAAFLASQLPLAPVVSEKRMGLWNQYYHGLESLEKAGKLRRPPVDPHKHRNGHIFYLLTNGEKEKHQLLRFLNNLGIGATFHYQPLHQSPYFKKENTNIPHLPNCQDLHENLIRLPMFADLEPGQLDFIIESVHRFYQSQ